ncbi:lantibiotic dehydratase [Sphaerisporangium album]|nr:lantibiotic dehydratase [Sphaerisporangium album]
MTARPARWELHPQFILRSTGFPFALLERISFPLTSARIDALLDAEEALTTAADAAIAHLKDSDHVTDGRLRRKLWKILSRHRPLSTPAEASPVSVGELPAETRALLDRYGRTLERLAEAERDARAEFGAELPVRRRALRDLVADERFQEAVWLSSPQMYERGLRGYLAAGFEETRTGRVRSLERQLAGYLQRVAAKNETASFFGPINYGTFTPRPTPASSPVPPADLPEPEAQRTEPATADAPRAGVVTRRHAYVAYWVVQALAARLGADAEVRPHLRPRVSTLARPAADGSSVTLARTRKVALRGRAAELLPLVDGKRTATTLAQEVGAPVGEVVAELERLARARIVAYGVDLPVTEPRALEALRDRVAELPDDCPARETWLRRLDRLRDLQEEFASADFGRRRELLDVLERETGELTGLEARRAGGQLYADRLVITEECLGAATPLQLGEDVLRLLTAELGPVLDLLAAEAVTTHADLTAAALKSLNLKEGDRLPLPTYLTRPWPATTSDRTAVEARPLWRAEIEDRLLGDGRPVALGAADVAVDPGTLAGRALICSPDVMIVARDLDAVRAGDFTLVLAESHDTVLLWGWALQFLDDPAAAQDEIGALLTRVDSEHPLANMLTSKRAKIVPFEFPGATVEASQPSHRAGGRTIPVGEVDVVVRDGRLMLSAPGHDGFLLYNGELDSPAHNVLAPPRVRPVAFGRGGPRHTPRVSIGRTVVQRERWVVARDELAPEPARGAAGEDTSFALLVALRRAARRHGLPRWVFAKIPGERKPVLLDTEGLFLAELLAHLSEPGTDLTLSEMLPGPGHLWLEGPEGAHCTELRLSAVRTTTDPVP